MQTVQQVKCHNFGNCSKAENQEDIDIEAGSVPPYQCPECGIELDIPIIKESNVGKIILLFVGISVVCGMLYAFWPELDEGEDPAPIALLSPTTCSPLKMEGKKHLFQRVLIKPGSYKAENLGVLTDQKITSFSRYYVYARKKFEGEEWLHISASNTQCANYWVNANNTLEWRQQLALTLTNPASAGRGRADFFETQQALQYAINNPDLPESQLQLVARESGNYVDPQTQFYLMPILEYAMDGDINLLKVATATLNPESVNFESNDISHETAIVFVIDTTISMQPYIEQVKQAVEKVFQRFQSSSLQKYVKFGLIGFRSSLKKTPGLEYTTKIFVDPGIPQQERRFMDIISSMDEAPVSSYQFNEDSYAGVLAAINHIEWQQFLGKVVILITDAGAIGSDEKFSDGSHISKAEDYNADSINAVAQSKGISLYTLHMQTPSGLRNHRLATRQYTDLTKNDVTNSSLYFGQKIKKGQTDLFSDSLECIIQSWTDLMLRIDENNSHQASFIAQRCPESSLESANPNFAKSKQKLRSDQLLLGNALRLQYLGLKEGTQVPSVVQGWISDRTQIGDAAKVKVNVLLTRNELSSLAEKTQAIIDSYQPDADMNETGSQAERFFTRLQTQAAKTVNDPNLSIDSTLAEMFDLKELLDLPYKSQIMGVTSDAWEEYSYSQRDSLIATLRSKKASYKAIERDSSRWHQLSEGAGEAVALIPLTLLP